MTNFQERANERAESAAQKMVDRWDADAGAAGKVEQEVAARVHAWNIQQAAADRFGLTIDEWRQAGHPAGDEVEAIKLTDARSLANARAAAPATEQEAVDANRQEIDGMFAALDGKIDIYNKVRNAGCSEESRVIAARIMKEAGQAVDERRAAAPVSVVDLITWEKKRDADAKWTEDARAERFANVIATLDDSELREKQICDYELAQSSPDAKVIPTPDELAAKFEHEAESVDVDGPPLHGGPGFEEVVAAHDALESALRDSRGLLESNIDMAVAEVGDREFISMLRTQLFGLCFAVEAVEEVGAP